MNLRTSLRAAGCGFGLLCFGAGLSAPAATISVTYSYTIGVAGDPANPPLIGTGSGSLLPFGDMTWSDNTFPDLATGAFTGTFTMTFANGTLFGDFSGQTDLTAPPTATPLAQFLNVTGGTGVFLGYTGTLTGSGTLNLVTLQETDSGSGTLNTAPEPGSVALLSVGLLCCVAYLQRRRFAKKDS